MRLILPPRRLAAALVLVGATVLVAGIALVSVPLAMVGAGAGAMLLGFDELRSR